jgi:ABC-type hemin transport system substrate-binding protein
VKRALPASQGVRKFRRYDAEAIIAAMPNVLTCR